MKTSEARQQKISQETLEELDEIGIPRIDSTLGGIFEINRPEEASNESLDWEDVVVKLLSMPEKDIQRQSNYIELKESGDTGLRFLFFLSQSPVILLEENRIMKKGQSMTYAIDDTYGILDELSRRRYWTFSYAFANDEITKQWERKKIQDPSIYYDSQFITPSFASLYFNFLSWYYKYKIYVWITGETGFRPSDDVHGQTYREVDAALIRLWDSFR